MVQAKPPVVSQTIEPPASVPREGIVGVLGVARRAQIAGGLVVEAVLAWISRLVAVSPALFSGV